MATVRRFYLLRHAKSSWDDRGLDDHARPLSPRGEAAARDISAYLRGEAVEPALVLCSTAVRARQTIAAWPRHGEVRYEDALYGASAAELLARLHDVPDLVGPVMVVGHNPGLHELAVSCTGKGDAHVLARLREKLPTGALATLSFSGPWASLAPGRATLEGLVVPGDL